MRELAPINDNPDQIKTKDFFVKFDKLKKIGEECKKRYLVSGSSNGVTFSGEICGLHKSFTINVGFPGGDTAITTFNSNTFTGGTTTVTGGVVIVFKLAKGLIQSPSTKTGMIHCNGIPPTR